MTPSSRNCATATSAATGSGSSFPSCAAWATARQRMRYGISSLGEARAYLAHGLLGPRLRECARLITQIDGRSAEDIFGWPDDLKVRSSMTLFARATDDNADFVAVLDKFYDGDRGPAHRRAAQLAR